MYLLHSIAPLHKCSPYSWYRHIDPRSLLQLQPYFIQVQIRRTAKRIKKVLSQQVSYIQSSSNSLFSYLYIFIVKRFLKPCSFARWDFDISISIEISENVPNFAFTYICVGCYILRRQDCTKTYDNPLDSFGNSFSLRHCCG